jgi:DNA-binding NtrC family response regulator
MVSKVHDPLNPSAGSPVAAAPPRVLVAEDDGALARMLERVLAAEGLAVSAAPDAESLARSVESEPDVVLLDLHLEGGAGPALVGRIRESSPDSEIVVMTGCASVDTAVECMRLGAFDYLEKPFGDRHRVVHTVRQALDRRLLRVRNRELEVELGRRSALERIVGRSEPMRRVTRMVRDLAKNESNVLIEAESGTGKELIARAIHETSPRRDGPFVPVDCGALPEGIVESELFGYEKGAFTDASRASPGLFRTAHGGTLFLDEIGELPLVVQSKLLRVIQQREVRPLGASAPIAVDVRIVAATNRELATEVKHGRFRADLFYRLRVVSIQLPPLRERPEDVPLLAMHFLERCARGTPVRGFEPEALEALIAHPWEGNVRELENAIEAAVALARKPRLSVAELGLARRGATPTVPAPEGIALSLAAYERACLEQALARTGGDVGRAAELLGIGRSTLYRKLHEVGLRPARGSAKD